MIRAPPHKDISLTPHGSSKQDKYSILGQPKTNKPLTCSNSEGKHCRSSYRAPSEKWEKCTPSKEPHVAYSVRAEAGLHFSTQEHPNHTILTGPEWLCCTYQQVVSLLRLSSTILWCDENIYIDDWLMWGKLPHYLVSEVFCGGRKQGFPLLEVSWAEYRKNRSFSF